MRSQNEQQTDRMVNKRKLSRRKLSEVSLRMAAREVKNDRRQSCRSGEEKAQEQEKPKSSPRRVGAVYL